MIEEESPLGGTGDNASGGSFLSGRGGGRCFGKEEGMLVDWKGFL